MRRCRMILLIVALLVSSTAFSDSRAETAAADAAMHWLALVDAGNFAGSWDEAASLFKESVSKTEWAKMLEASRARLGKVESRALKSATYTTSLPGAPDGQYVVIRYDSSFEHKKSAIETVTPMLDKDGRWKVSGYFIR